ncbi:vesicle-associated membrane protein 7-like [Amphibalanus amphitrite]|uniref:vesicle-associated membrane protein 7-like n=1 Tax=Amphibalanus amphitrite TaxID=1232801 RepID=UPI001C91043A|nr:vesicle-associated membrane protein 7-like [Amphibalanus amphitrite]XP_043188712.1 vesicle-associated membrane protein 7-like [Amphibalanus amphitrite]XP_043188720.1 vesicle-associated membrane protein 7-like [Amphibalanus amphitrite]XP_043188728.1 vesicle-associated membrane protein 7-like [Amphibalanus amphitrite]XP_043188735.1 vesicle-associated membrane protein 7-like [Amphibalanus amphitrite]XP_043188746.1 vesicle-associated membrane protein 7-like [Amphibalanus amphitrite]XP_04318875
MTILFSMISRGTTILAKCATCPGNFMEVVELILPKIGLQDSKLTYAHGDYLFHYVTEAGVIYLCITDDAFERSRAFSFLLELKKRFTTVYGYRLHSALPYAMNSEFSPLMASEMRRYSESRSTLAKAQADMDELKEIMVQNIDSIASRGERLELLVSKTENLSANSVSFRSTSRNLARAMWWKNVKIIVACAVVCLLVLYGIVTYACGGFKWSKCT